jgi:hypothetical protein
MQTPDPILGLMDRFTAALNAHDLDTALGLVTDDIVFESTSPLPDGARYDRACGQGRIVSVTLAYLVQHGEKQPLPGDPGLTQKGRQQATETGRWLRGLGVRALYSSPLRRARRRPDVLHRSLGFRFSSMSGCVNA